MRCPSQSRMLLTVGPLLAVLHGGVAAEPFVTLERFDADSRAGAEVTGVVAAVDPASRFRLDAHGHYVPPGSGWGGYAQALGGYDRYSAPRADVAHAEAGGIYMPDLSSTTITLVLHGGLAYVPGAAAVTLGVSPIYRTDELTVRVDVGLDVERLNGSAYYDPRVHVKFGVGSKIGETLFAAVELSSLTRPRQTEPQYGALAGLSLRFDLERVLPYVALMRAVGEGVVGPTITVGVEARI